MFLYDALDHIGFDELVGDPGVIDRHVHENVLGAEASTSDLVRETVLPDPGFDAGSVDLAFERIKHFGAA